ncbi:unspecified signal transduction; unspecified kinase or ATP dependent regulatory protein; cellular communication/signal transduction [hydrothermal vent metagenome]|uniref:Unspecified signal transduction unspecified kinase or ATP dependent regulatory protein cellular communication/signal transduction n=1 Tax=hydrothermal vent metagenome TaxID=652676 RepID=A0A3B1D7V0_9ZZZZ
MAIKLTAESFLAVVKQSGLIEQDQLKRLLQEFKQQGVKMEDSRAIAEQLVARKTLTRWQADKLLKGKHKGFFLGKYRLLSLLGKGGMSSVYLAEHVLMRRRCAIKVLPAKRVNDTSYLGRFYREAQAVAALDHPNIVRAYDVDKEIEKDTEIHFLVMEFVQGESLQDMVSRKGVLDFIETAEFIRQGAEGLHHAHVAGMVHRDVKPGNLLVDKTNVVKILDLGLARFFNDTDEESLTVAHDEKVLGTADYLAPEQALDSHTVDERADIYSLGCTFYFLLAGHPPFTEGTLAQRLMAHQTKTPPPIEEKREGVPAGLITIINKMMAKNLDERYQSGEEVATVLAAWLIESADEKWMLSHPALAGTGSSVRVAQPDDKKPRKKVRRKRKKSDNALIDTNSANSSQDTQTKNPIPDPVLEAPAVQKTHEDELASFLSNLDSGVASAGTGVSGKSPSSPSVLSSQPPSSVIDPMQQSAVRVAPVISKRPAIQPKPASVIRQPASAIKPVEAPVTSPSSTTLNEQNPPFDFKTFIQTPAGMISMAVAGVMLAGILIWGMFALFGTPEKNVKKNSVAKIKKNKDSEVGNDPRQLLGSDIVVGSSPAAHFVTIKEALRYVKRNYRPDQYDLNAFQVITIFPGIYHERIEIDNEDNSDSKFPASVHLVAAGGASVVLAPGGAAPIINLSNNVEGFHIDGLTIDAKEAKIACVLNGNLPGTALKNMTIRGFSQTGILGKGSVGITANNQEVLLENIKFNPASPTSVAIRFRSDEENGNDALGISIKKCRFSGKMQAAIKFETNAFHIDIRESIFNQNDIGIWFEGVNRDFRRVTIANNTFYKNKNGIVFTSRPGGKSNEITFRRNLFYQTTGADLIVQSGFKSGSFSTQVIAKSNMTTDIKPPVAGEKELFKAARKIPKGQKILFDSTDSRAANFLKVKAPSTKVPGTNDGLKPYIGAVAP